MKDAPPTQQGRTSLWRSVRTVAAFVIAAVCFFCVVSFFAAVGPERALADGHPLPAGWSAGVINHGKYYQWYLIEDRPWLFATTLVYLVIFSLFTWSMGIRNLRRRGSRFRRAGA